MEFSNLYLKFKLIFYTDENFREFKDNANNIISSVNKLLMDSYQVFSLFQNKESDSEKEAKIVSNFKQINLNSLQLQKYILSYFSNSETIQELGELIDCIDVPNSHKSTSLLLPNSVKTNFNLPKNENSKQWIDYGETHQPQIVNKLKKLVEEKATNTPADGTLESRTIFNNNIRLNEEEENKVELQKSESKKVHQLRESEELENRYRRQIDELNTKVEQLQLKLEQAQAEIRCLTTEKQAEIQEERPPREKSYIGDSLEKILHVKVEVKKLEAEIKNFSGEKTDKVYLHLKEMLLRNILKLDSIESGGSPTIRKNRKIVVEYAQDLLNKLNMKCSS